jgi:hypothetical protein
VCENEGSGRVDIKASDKCRRWLSSSRRTWEYKWAARGGGLRAANPSGRNEIAETSSGHSARLSAANGPHSVCTPISRRILRVRTRYSHCRSLQCLQPLPPTRQLAPSRFCVSPSIAASAYALPVFSLIAGLTDLAAKLCYCRRRIILSRNLAIRMTIKASFERLRSQKTNRPPLLVFSFRILDRHLFRCFVLHKPKRGLLARLSFPRTSILLPTISFAYD